MVLKKLSRAPRPAEFLTYDLEWFPRKAYIPKDLWMKLRLVGVFDGINYRHYPTVEAFFLAEFSPDNDGKRFYAHAGGLADVLYLVPVLRRAGYSMRAAFSGSSAIIIKVIKDDCHWLLVDALWTLKSSLKKIGEAMKMPKGEVRWDCPDSELVTYNEQDCRILWTALKQFEDLLLELGSELKITLASTAMALIRRRYLGRDLVTSGPVNTLLRDSYYGGRVEVYKKYAERGGCYDINSSFPYAMYSAPLPGRLLRTTTSRGMNIPAIPTADASQYFARLTVEVDRYIPPLPCKVDGSLYFPVGRWTGWFFKDEIALLEDREIIKVHEVMDFEPRYDLCKFAEEIYSLRKAETDEFREQLYKYILNSGYGKFAERLEKDEIIFNPTPDVWDDIHTCKCGHVDATHGESGDTHCEECRCSRFRGILELSGPPPMLGVLAVEHEADLQHVHVPFAAAITSRARANLYRHEVANEPVFYVDTDSICTSREVATSKELGDLKLVYKFSPELGGAEFVSGKLYRIGMEAKAKGFPLKRIVKEAYDAGEGSDELYEDYEPRAMVDLFTYIRDGNTLKFPRMVRLREAIRSGNLEPREMDTSKKLSFKVRPKRKFDFEGNSAPWNIDELTKG